MEILSQEQMQIMFKESEDMLKALDIQLNEINEKKTSENININPNLQNIIKENEKLIIEHKNKLNKIKEYTTQINELQNKISLLKSTKTSLENENQNLKQKLPKNNDKKKSYGKFLQLFKAKCIKEIQEKKNEEEKKEEKKEENIKDEEPKNEDKGELKRIKTIKDISETIYSSLEKKIIKYFDEINEQGKYITNFRNYIDKVKNQIDSCNQEIRICVSEESKINYDNINNEIIKLIDKIRNISVDINKENDNYTHTKEFSLIKAENILTSLKSKINKTNKEKSFFELFKNRIINIKNKINDLEKISKDLEEYITKSKNKKKEIEKNINDLKIDIEKFMKNYEDIKSKIKTDINNSIKINSNNLEEEEKEEKDAILDFSDSDEDKDKDIKYDPKVNIDLESSFLIGLKDFDKNIKQLNTNILFKNKNESEDKKIKTPQILTKNWNEVCYIYDNYDIHDINFEIKAVGLKSGFFDSFSNLLDFDKFIDIMEFEINGKKSPYQYKDFTISYKIKLYNLQKNKIHLKYKASPDYDIMSDEKYDKYDFYRIEKYGLNAKLSGQMAKYSMILKGTFEIVKFEKEFLIPNVKNLIEKEYIWGGKVPQGGNETLITFSKNEANWKIHAEYEIFKKGKFGDNTIRVYMFYIGGNNLIVDNEYYSHDTKKIVVDKTKQSYDILYLNTNFVKSDFFANVIVKNKCTGDWAVDFSDDDVDYYFPKEDKKDKEKLQKIAKKIIEDFDKNNKSIYFNYMDYQKIGKWVYENIKYNIKLLGKEEFSALEIYNKKEGVCHHITKLTNALLYSLGYKVLYARGYCAERNNYKDVDIAHCWSLIKINEKWYPFDVTWNILTGKLPVCHIFESIKNLNNNYRGLSYKSKQFIIDDYIIDIKLI